MSPSHKDAPRFASVPEMPSPKYDYRSSDCRPHANRYAARKLRNPGPDLEVEERGWLCVGCLIGAPPSHLSASTPFDAAAESKPAKQPASATRTVRTVVADAGTPTWLACVVGRSGLTERRLYLAVEIHQEDSGYGRVLLQDDNGIKANCDLSRFVRVLADQQLDAIGWRRRGREWRHDKHGSVLLVCAKDGPGAGVGKFSIVGTTILVDGHVEALAQSAALSARPVIAEPLRLAIINEDDSAVALTEPAPLNASARAPAEPNTERSAAE
jgi:hypothetical protein